MAWNALFQEFFSTGMQVSALFISVLSSFCSLQNRVQQSVQLCGNFMHNSMYYFFILCYMYHDLHVLLIGSMQARSIKCTDVFGFKIVINIKHSYRFFHIAPNLYKHQFMIGCLHFSFTVSAKVNYVVLSQIKCSFHCHVKARVLLMLLVHVQSHRKCVSSNISLSHLFVFWKCGFMCLQIKDFQSSYAEFVVTI